MTLYIWLFEAGLGLILGSEGARWMGLVLCNSSGAVVAVGGQENGGTVLLLGLLLEYKQGREKEGDVWVWAEH